MASKPNMLKVFTTMASPEIVVVTPGSLIRLPAGSDVIVDRPEIGTGHRVSVTPYGFDGSTSVIMQG